jgi:hypothetical protein
MSDRVEMEDFDHRNGPAKQATVGVTPNDHNRQFNKGGRIKSVQP